MVKQKVQFQEDFLQSDRWCLSSLTGSAFSTYPSGSCALPRDQGSQARARKPTLLECTFTAFYRSIQLSRLYYLADSASLSSIHSFAFSAPLSVSVLLLWRAPHPTFLPPSSPPPPKSPPNAPSRCTRPATSSLRSPSRYSPNPYTTTAPLLTPLKT